MNKIDTEETDAGVVSFKDGDSIVYCSSSDLQRAMCERQCSPLMLAANRGISRWRRAKVEG